MLYIVTPAACFSVVVVVVTAFIVVVLEFISTNLKFPILEIFLFLSALNYSTCVWAAVASVVSKKATELSDFEFKNGGNFGKI